MSITGGEVSKHDSRASCWLVIHGKVWDVTGTTDFFTPVSIAEVRAQTTSILIPAATTFC